jgi:hypothetical protein
VNALLLAATVLLSASSSLVLNAIVSFGEDDAGELYVVDYNGSVFELTMPADRRRAVRH